MIAFAFALALIAEPQELPPVCQPPEGVAPDWEACVDALPEGSPDQRFFRMRMATDAYFARDYGTAARVFDQVGVLDDFASDAVYAFRADTYQQVGRDKEATADARAAWLVMSTPRPAFDGPPPAAEAASEETRRFLLSLILPILKKGRDSAFEPAFAAFRALPVKDTEGYASLAVVLEQLGDFDGALEASLVTVKAAPTDPGYLNNHCYILVRAGRPGEGLPFCEKAVQAAPALAPLQHSLASALAGIGRCEDAEAALAEARRLDPATVLYQQPLTCTAS